jgi:hypothetical protein
MPEARWHASTSLAQDTNLVILLAFSFPILIAGFVTLDS